MSAKRHYDVVCGVISNESSQILVSFRDAGSDQGGVWEFPGGKVEFSESIEDALCRELREEIGIELLEATEWLQLNHEYPLYHVTLYVFKILSYEGTPQSLENQPLKWVTLKELSKLELPEANYPIVSALLDV